MKLKIELSPAISGVESGGDIFLPFLLVEDLSLSVRCSDDLLEDPPHT